jgi:hypothetical protein
MFRVSFSVILLANPIPVEEAGNKVKCSPLLSWTGLHDRAPIKKILMTVIRIIYLPSATR